MLALARNWMGKRLRVARQLMDGMATRSSPRALAGDHPCSESRHRRVGPVLHGPPCVLCLCVTHECHTMQLAPLTPQQYIQHDRVTER